RRHTRWPRDWSSDVCSSDLAAHRAGVRPVPCLCGSERPPHRVGCPRNQNGHNLSEISPHTLRRTYASDLLNRGLRLEVVSKLLRSEERRVGKEWRSRWAAEQ